METMTTILNRRSTRKYEEKRISEDKINLILQAGLLAPTGHNKKACEFYVVQDRELLNKLSKAKKLGAAMLAECDTAIVVLCNSRKTDTWVEDCSIALSYMSLMATDQGVGNCWCQMHLRSSLTGKDAEENVRELLGADNDYRLVGVLALGMAAQNIDPHKKEDADWEKIHRL